jgi:predicted nucleotide-binding protein
MKKMKVTRDCVTGKIAQCNAAATAANTAAKANRRGAVFSIHGHRRASLNS